MARTVKCYICKKDLNKEDAYTWIYISKTNKEYKDEIIKYLELSGIDKEYNKIAYMFTIIGNKIEDFSKEDERVNQWEQYKQTEEEVEVEVEDIEVPTDMKVKKRKTLF